MSTFQISLIFAFLAMIFWGVGDFLIQKTVRKVGDVQSLFLICLIASLILFPFVLSDLPIIFSWPNILFLIIISVINLFYSFFLFKAYDKGKLAVIEVIMIGELPLTVILGLIFFHEKLNLLQILAIGAIIFGIFLTSKNRLTWWNKVKQFFTGKKIAWEKGIWLMLGAVVFSSLYNFLTVVNTRSISAFTAVWFPWITVSIFLFVYIVYKKGLKTLGQVSLKNKSLILFTGIIDTAAWVFYALATRQEELSLVIAIGTGYAVIAMILGIKFNKEKIGPWQYLGAVLVFLGVAIVTLVAN